MEGVEQRLRYQAQLAPGPSTTVSQLHDLEQVIQLPPTPEKCGSHLLYQVTARIKRGLGGAPQNGQQDPGPRPTGSLSYLSLTGCVTLDKLVNLFVPQ